MGRKIGRDKSWVSKLENERLPYPPTRETILALANELGLVFEELIKLSGRNDLNNQKSLIRKFKKIYQQNPQKTTLLIEKMSEDKDFTDKLFKQLK